MVRVFRGGADVDLDPIHLAGELIRDWVIVSNEGSILDADVAGVVRREDHGRGSGNLIGSDLDAVEVQRRGSALPEQVVAIARLAVFEVKAPAADAAALRDDDALGPPFGTSISAVIACDLFLTLTTEFSESRPMPAKRS